MPASLIWAVLCAALCLQSAEGMIVVALRGDIDTYEAFSDMQASFGPGIPVDGISGNLILADPLEACVPLTPPRLPRQRERDNATRWVALIARSHSRTDDCTFDIKVRNAEAAGATAAIIYDDLFEGLLVMAAPPGNPEPTIPSVFVSQASGALIRQMLVPGQSTQVFMSPSPSLLWASMLMSAIAGSLAVSVVMSAFYLARRPVATLVEEDGGGGGGTPAAPRRRRNPTLPPEQLRLLPVLVHEERDGGDSSSDSGSDAEDRQPSASAGAGATPVRLAAGDTKRLCAICLELYVAGDKLRLLPCQHRYHTECIDPWLSQNSLKCPVCKQETRAALAAAADLEAGEGGSGGGSSGEEAAGAATEGPGVRRAAEAALSALRERWAAWRGGRRGGEVSEEAAHRLLPLAEGPARAPSDNAVPATAAAV